jgi:hypothetical protein
MTFTILRILLWPKDSSKQVRALEFSSDQLNVITGRSGTGKSALIDIIDYCLCSGRCGIPVGVIREKTAWFGLHLRIGDTELVLARREPGHQAQSGEMFWLQDKKVKDTPTPSYNQHVDSVKSKLNDLIGLPNLEFDQGEGISSFAGRPSIRDLVSFVFQPQHIVANPYTLFYKADTFENQQKLKVVFPLALGSITNQTLILKRELRDLERELQQKQKEVDARRTAAKTWESEVKSNFSRARELGLLSPEVRAGDNWTTVDYFNLLSSIPNNVSSTSLFRVPEGASENVVRELNELQSEERALSIALEQKKRRLSALESLGAASMEFSDSLMIQKERLEPVGWLSAKIKMRANCPFCESQTESAKIRLDALKVHLQVIEDSQEGIEKSARMMDREIASLGSELRQLEKALNTVREHREQLEEKSDRVRESRQLLEEVYRFVGRLEQSIQNYRSTLSNSDLDNELAQLRNRVAFLDRQLKSLDEAGLTRRALDVINAKIKQYSASLGVERPNDAVSLDLRNLTVTVTGQDGRPDHLWEIGSGANWLGYHLSTAIALQEYFIGRGAENITPSFLVFDQPSQVYFPERFPGEPDPKTGKVYKSLEEASDDILRVREVFQVLAQASVRNANRLQIIVIDHADASTWQDVPNLKVVARFRDEKALIPAEWLN